MRPPNTRTWTQPDLADGADIGLGPYDRVAAEDPWFLPELTVDDDFAPLPRADRSALLQPDQWIAAQATLALPLAALACQLGRLSERLRRAPLGRMGRLALREASELGWSVGDHIPEDRLLLWSDLHLPGPQDDSQALSRVTWVWRRLVQGAAPEVGGWSDWLAAFLARPAEAVAELAATMDDPACAALHPVTRALLLFTGWRIAGPDGPLGELEAAALAAASVRGSLGLPFLPRAMGGLQGQNPSARPQDRLAQWIATADRASHAALALLDRVEVWEAGAIAATRDLQGRTPVLLIALFANLPHLTAALAEGRTGAGRSTVQRNMDALAARGLIREMTGQGRYRVWTARL